MKKLLFALVAFIGAASAHSDLTTTAITPENCVECVKQGTSREAVVAQLRKLVEDGAITREVEESCVAALDAMTE